MSRMSRVFKSRWLFHIDFFGKFPIQESTFDIHLENSKVLVSNMSKKDLCGFKSSDPSNNFTFTIVILIFGIPELQV